MTDLTPETRAECGCLHPKVAGCDHEAPEPPSGRAGEVTAEELDTAAYWQGRFLRMRAMYRERFNEGLSTEDWHRKHCGLMNAPEAAAEELARFLYDAAGFHAADSWDTETPIVRGHYEAPAAAIFARFDVRRRP